MMGLKYHKVNGLCYKKGLFISSSNLVNLIGFSLFVIVFFVLSCFGEPSELRSVVAYSVVGLVYLIMHSSFEDDEVRVVYKRPGPVPVDYGNHSDYFSREVYRKYVKRSRKKRAINPQKDYEPRRLIGFDEVDAVMFGADALLSFYEGCLRDVKKLDKWGYSWYLKVNLEEKIDFLKSLNRIVSEEDYLKLTKQAEDEEEIDEDEDFFGEEFLGEYADEDVENTQDDKNSTNN